MKVFKIGRLGGVAVLAGAMILVTGAPAAATDAPCAARAVSVADDLEAEGGLTGGRQLSFVLTTSGCLSGSVEYATTFSASSPAPWAMAPGDYTTVTGTVWWSRGSDSSFIVNVPIVGDDWVELDESVTLVLRNPSSAVTVERGTAVGKILNDDLTQVGADSEPDCGMTAATTCEFIIELSRRVVFDVSVSFTTSNGTANAGQEFEGVPSGAIVIPAGAVRASARIALVSGHVIAVPKYFYVNLVGTSVGTIAVSRIRVTIPVP